MGKMDTIRIVCAGAFFAAATGCVPTTAPPIVSHEEIRQEATIQQELATQASNELLNQIRAEHAAASLRVNTIHRRLMRANLEFCEKTVSSIGALIANRNTFAPNFWSSDPQFDSEWADLYLTDEYMRVLEVLPSSPAERSGFLAGNVVTHVSGIPVGTGASGNSNFKRAMQGTDGKSLTFSRDGFEHTIFVQPEVICDMPMVVVNSDDINAYADGNAIYLNAGMERIVRDDSELAFVIGHEMAHNILKHIDSAVVNSIIGGLIGVAIDPSLGEAGAEVGALAYSQEFETEADYVGLYLAARAGYDVSNVAEFWRAMATINPSAIHVPSLTHPTTAMRYNVIKKTSEEIDRKRSLGQSLLYAKL
ncbi:MAG: M48 family metallopeptidase [Rhodobacteraceae bacterium]|nr:M48 family metallopeptidase [Paracoccaceae bacterium]